ncbi:MAG: VWA domain-containing protein [Verrucomicrobiaceae bacterium]
MTFLLITPPLQAVEQVDAIEVWGHNNQQQLEIPEGMINVKGLAVGSGHLLAIKNDGTVAAWGYNATGQSDVPPDLEDVVAVAASSRHSLALKSDGTVVQWGDPYPTDTPVPPGLNNVRAIASSLSFGMALKNDGTVETWGTSAVLKLIEGNFLVRRPPAGLSGVTAISGGGDFALALKSDGTVVAWGLGLIVNNSQAVEPPPVDLDNVVQISAGFRHALALKSDGTVVAWGDNGSGQSDVPTDLTRVVEISAGTDHSLALKSDGTVVGWGSDSNGQISLPSSLNQVSSLGSGNLLSAAITKKNAYQVDFKRGDHGVINSGSISQVIIEGESATAPILSPDAHWSVLDWGTPLSNITQDQTFTAQYQFNIPPSAGVHFRDPIEAFVELPSYVTVAFRLTDQAGRGLNVPHDIVTGDDFFEVFEDGQPLSPSESFLQVAKIDEASAEIKTVLMLDNSFSVAPNLAQIKTAAKGIIAKAIPGQTFAIYSFSGSPLLLQDFTTDVAALEAAIDSIGFGQPTTNLYGSAIEGLSRWSDSYTSGNVTRGFMVLLTDGSDQSGLNTLNEVLTARGDKQIYTIGLGSEIDQASLNQIGNAGNYEIEDVAELDNVFDLIQTEIKNDTNSFYWLNYVSPKRGNNTHSLLVSLKDNPWRGQDSVLRVDFNSDGFSDVSPQVLVNRGVFTPEGLSSITLTDPEGMTINADTMLGFVDSNYQWTLADPSLANIVSVTNGEVVLKPLVAGTTTLTVTDLANDAIVPNFFFATLPVTIAPSALPQLSFSAWTENSGLSGNNALPNSDPNNDGIDNLLSYALGIDPVNGLNGSPGASLPSASAAAPAAQISFNIPSPIPAGLTYVVEENCDLSKATWTTIALSNSNGTWTGATNSSDNGNGYQTITADSSLPIISVPNCFLRIRVIQN